MDRIDCPWLIYNFV
ncbi:hypothetical protein [Rufibacter tibetensis]